jgi:hypothetical protein
VIVYSAYDVADVQIGTYVWSWSVARVILFDLKLIYLLDAFTSYLLLLTLSQLARRGRTVILSIHAPRSDAYDLFDRIVLLSKGQVVYSGSRSECLPWFSTLGHDLEGGINPLGERNLYVPKLLITAIWLDFLIDISSIDNRDPEKEEMSAFRVGHLISSWQTRSPSYLLPKEGIRTSTSMSEPRQSNDDDNNENDPPTSMDSKRPGFWKQTKVLTARAHRNVYRNVPQLVGYGFQALVLGFIIGMTFYQLPDVSAFSSQLGNHAAEHV